MQDLEIFGVLLMPGLYLNYGNTESIQSLMHFGCQMWDVTLTWVHLVLKVITGWGCSTGLFYIVTKLHNKLKFLRRIKLKIGL